MLVWLSLGLYKVSLLHLLCVQFLPNLAQDLPPQGSLLRWCKQYLCRFAKYLLPMSFYEIELVNMFTHSFTHSFNQLAIPLTLDLRTLLSSVVFNVSCISTPSVRTFIIQHLASSTRIAYAFSFMLRFMLILLFFFSFIGSEWHYHTYLLCTYILAYVQHMPGCGKLWQ